MILLLFLTILIRNIRTYNYSDTVLSTKLRNIYVDEKEKKLNFVECLIWARHYLNLIIIYFMTEETMAQGGQVTL